LINRLRDALDPAKRKIQNEVSSSMITFLRDLTGFVFLPNRALFLTKFIVIIFVGASVTVMSVTAQERSLPIAELNREMLTELAEKRFDKALIVARKLLEASIKENGPQSEQTAIIYANIGVIYRQINKFDDAVSNLKLALTVRRQLSSGGSKSVFDLLGLLADCQYRNEDYAAADSTYRQAIEMTEKAALLAPKETYDIVLGAAKTAARLKDYGRANELFIRSLRLSFDLFAFDSVEREDLIISRKCLFERFPVTASLRKDFDEEQKLLAERDKVRNDTQVGKAVRLPIPEYSPEARAKGLYGKVFVRVRIDLEGKVSNALVICSDSILGGLAVKAAGYAKFQPTYIKGKAVPFGSIVTYEFVRPN
jgi:TonB family protein